MAEERDEVLDLCVEAARRGEDPEAVLRQHADVAGDVRPLLALALELAALPAPQPSAAGMARLFTRLAAEEAAPALPRRLFFTIRRRVLAVAAALLVLLGGWGLIGASASAVPGDWLYPLKRLSERVSYALTLDASDRAELRISFADERLREAVRKHERGDGIDRRLLAAMLVEAVEALEQGSRLPATDRDLLARRLACSCEFQCRVLSELAGRASESERAAIEPYKAACEARCTCMDEVTAECRAQATSLAEAAERLRRLLPAPTDGAKPAAKKGSPAREGHRH